MNKNAVFQQLLLVWERDYRSFIQGVRSSLSILSVIILYFFTKNQELVFLGLCALSLTQACTRSPYWRFEFNIFLAYLISTALILIAYAYSKSYVTLALFSFFLAFFIHIFSYYKIPSVYSIWIFIIPQYSLFAQYNFQITVEHAVMNTYAFLISFFICAVLFRPRIKKECLHEMRSILREMAFYLESVENYTFNKSDESANYLTLRRQKIFLRIQSLRLMLNEIDQLRKKSRKSQDTYYIFYVLATLEERFIETTIGISIKLRALNIPLKYETQVRNVFYSLNKINKSLLSFLVYNKNIKIDDIKNIYEKLNVDVKKEFAKIEAVHVDFVDDEFFTELFAVALQLKDNIGLLNAEFKFLCRNE
ncbi:hypothetical protein [Fluviispira multicolorata]|uniref:FUSC family protein n=1 Tax=Fluviispira multicolorata TaxID=2654512 RepID=A0A833JEG6_9BACT|nr:hypothetical protein [Fluviispira multicolorata]KAB8033209.1 hypothetical protein GCL57_00495 [Fluviispira multicolorata]